MRTGIPYEKRTQEIAKGDTAGTFDFRKDLVLDVFDGLPLHGLSGGVASLLVGETMVPYVPSLLRSLEQNVLLAKLRLHSSLQSVHSDRQ